MRILLSEGSGLTARQVAGQLGDAGHEIQVLSSDPFCLARFTRRVRRTWKVPPYGDDPLGWLDAALEVAEKSHANLLFPTQEQVAVLAACSTRLADAGVRTIVPSFQALRAVQDKISAYATLEALGVAQPPATVLATQEAVEVWNRFPVYMKAPIGTATSGVWMVAGGQDLGAVVAAAASARAFEQGGLLAQNPVEGPLVMVQGVFYQGELIASHANLRVREGARGGASHKRSVDLPVVREQLKVVGDGLGWHGALSADVVLTSSGPVIIDINPRLVEPGNARRAGVDLVSPMVAMALGRRPDGQPPGQPDVSTHQLLLALLGAAQRSRTRRGVISELTDRLRHLGDYAHSVEELTPLAGDWRAGVPVVLATAAVLARPSLGAAFSQGAVTSYALTPAGWQQLLRHQK